MATISIAVEETLDSYATWTHVFQGANVTWLGFDTRQILGNFFIGLQGQPMNFWDAQIPPGSTILSATMEVTAFQASASVGYIGQMTAQRRSIDNNALLPMQLPFSSFVGWRRSFWDNMDVDLNDSVGGDIIETAGGTNNAAWAIKQLTIAPGTVPQREQLGQIFTMPASASNIIGSATLQMARTGAPAGSGRILVQGITFNRGEPEPDGVTIATSDDVLQSTIPTAPVTGSPVVFAFTGANQVALTVGTDYALIYDSDNTITNNADYVIIRHQNQFLTTGRQVHFGGGVGNDWQNYPGTVDANLWHTNGLNFITADIPWPFPTFVPGVTYTSPDITTLIQAQIDDTGYVQDAGVMVAINRAAPAVNNRVWRSNQHVTGPGPVLRITYEEPVVAGGMADPTLTGRHRARDFKEPFDLGYWRTKYGKRDHQAPPVPESDPALDLVELNAYLDETLAIQARFNDERARIAREFAEKAAEAELERQNDILQARVARLDQEQRELEVALDLAAQQLEEVHEAMRLVFERQRKQRNAEAAIAATMSLYF